MENFWQNETVFFIISTVVYLLEASLLFMVGKWAYSLFHRTTKVQQELVEHDNFAFAIAHVGYYIGLLLAIGSAIVGPSHGLLGDVIAIAVYGTLAILLVNLSILINDHFILNRFSVKKEILVDRNAGTGVIEAASAIAAGLIIFGAVTGESRSFLYGILTATAFWAIGQVLLMITAKVYAMIIPYDLHDEVEKDNVAAGIGFAGALLAIANVIRYGLMGDFVGWGSTLAEVGLEVLLGLLFLPLLRLITDRILLPGQRLTQLITTPGRHSTSAALVEAFAYTGGSILIIWAL